MAPTIILTFPISHLGFHAGLQLLLIGAILGVSSGNFGLLVCVHTDSINVILHGYVVRPSIQFARTFSMLPTELRYQIYHQIRFLERRYIPLYSSNVHNTVPWITTAPVPLLLQLNREAREWAGEFHQLAFGGIGHEAATYFDFALDGICLTLPDQDHLLLHAIGCDLLNSVQYLILQMNEDVCPFVFISGLFPGLKELIIINGSRDLRNGQVLESELEEDLEVGFSWEIEDNLLGDYWSEFTFYRNDQLADGTIRSGEDCVPPPALDLEQIRRMRFRN